MALKSGTPFIRRTKFPVHVCRIVLVQSVEGEYVVRCIMLRKVARGMPYLKGKLP